MTITRREALGTAFGIGAGLMTAPQLFGNHSEEPIRTGMGLVVYDCNIRRRWNRKQQNAVDLSDPFTFLQHCHRLGAGGMQTVLGELEPAGIRELRDFARRHDLFIDAIVKLPKSNADIDRFVAEMKIAREVGVQAARCTIIPGRRYERFRTLDEFREFERRGREMVRRAVPIAERTRVPIAIENHKDQRLDERLALFKEFESEYVGACVDTGNSFALLDGAYEPIAALAPYAHSIHLKDQALRATDDGFLLGDIPLGQGSFDLKRMVKILRDAKPKIRFALELITRDPLHVPCLTEEFHRPFPPLPATDLARTLRFVNDHPASVLQQVSSLPEQKQVELEDANIRESLRYAATELKL